MGNPLVSIIIPYYKRGEVFCQCLESVVTQDYPNFEVIVVDNHSEDGVRKVVEAKAPGARLIELPANMGACVARNAGFRAARGEMLIFVDDDMGFFTPQEITNSVQLLQNRPSAHVLAFQVCEPDTGELRLREWCHPRYWKDSWRSEFETHWFCEGASIFRREVFDACDGYYEPLFYGPEGWDLSLRLIDRGFRILYSPTLRIWHRPSKAGRTVSRQYYYFTRDYIWMAYKDYRFLDGMRFLLPKLAMMAYFTLRSRAFKPFFRGLWDGILGLRELRTVRKPISRATVDYLAALERSRPNLFVRLARHRSTVQL
jgi:GT2 family glycosyltransferase